MPLALRYSQPASSDKVCSGLSKGLPMVSGRVDEFWPVLGTVRSMMSSSAGMRLLRARPTRAWLSLSMGRRKFRLGCKRVLASLYSVPALSVSRFKRSARRPLVNVPSLKTVHSYCPNTLMRSCLLV